MLELHLKNQELGMFAEFVFLTRFYFLSHKFFLQIIFMSVIRTVFITFSTNFRDRTAIIYLRDGSLVFAVRFVVVLRNTPGVLC